MAMILYNIRHRGPLEYDKFSLNIFQHHNEVKRLLNKLDEKKNDKLKEKERRLDQTINTLCSASGMLQELLMTKKEMGDWK